jgi:hypothetical protein
MLNPKEVIDALILTGALEISAMDAETGEMVFAVTEKMERVAPEIYKEILEQANRDVLSLWEKGLLLMDITLDSPEVSPSEEALDRANWINLSESEYNTMNAVMRMFEGGI